MIVRSGTNLELIVPAGSNISLINDLSTIFSVNSTGVEVSNSIGFGAANSTINMVLNGTICNVGSIYGDGMSDLGLYPLGTGNNVSVHGNVNMQSNSLLLVSNISGTGSGTLTIDNSNARIDILSQDNYTGEINLRAGSYYSAIEMPSTGSGSNMAIRSGTGIIDFGSNNISNIAKFNGFAASPITNDGRRIFYSSGSVNLSNSSVQVQIAGPTYTGSPAVKLGILPSGMYNVMMMCPSNYQLNVSCVIQAANATGAVVGGQHNQAGSNISTSIYITSSFPDYYINFQSLVSGSTGGDDFFLYISLISGEWDGTNSWEYP
jgi:hypothetical protein